MLCFIQGYVMLCFTQGSYVSPFLDRCTKFYLSSPPPLSYHLRMRRGHGGAGDYRCYIPLPPPPTHKTHSLHMCSGRGEEVMREDRKGRGAVYLKHGDQIFMNVCVFIIFSPRLFFLHIHHEVEMRSVDIYWYSEMTSI